jgi:FlaA1/EpsC-like NDP-sugar epimerase
MNVIEAAMDAGVRKVVALSTDKAYQPVSAYGQSKALAETLFRNAYRKDRGRCSPSRATAMCGARTAPLSRNGGSF